MPKTPAGLRRRDTDQGDVGISAILRRPFNLGFVGTLGVLLALLLAVITASLSTVLTYIGLALFLALGLNPTVLWLQRRKLPRPAAVAVVFAFLLLLVAAAVIFFVPPLVREVTSFIEVLPTSLSHFDQQDWFIALNAAVGQTIDLNAVADWVRNAASNPNVWANATGGLLKFGAGIIGGAVGAITVLILTIFFLASLPAMKRYLYALVARPYRPRFIELSEQIVDSVGGYVNGMVILSALNAALGFIAMLIFGVPFAGVIAVVVFFVAFIPLVGSILATILTVIVALFNSPVSAIGIGIYYLIYMQVEAYVLTPRVMSKTVAVPGALVVIGAMAGGTLLGVVGALVAIPVTASILLIINKVVLPRQDQKGTRRPSPRPSA